MPLSWNEIRHRAIVFSKEWTGVKSERAEKQTFWNEFFNVFGIRRRVVASFEEPVKKISGEYGYIDLFWPGVVLVEHKSFGKDLGKAESQAFRYIQDLARDGRMNEIPRYVIVSDFARIALYDLEPEERKDLPLFAGRRVASLEFPLADFHKQIPRFAFIAGYQQHKFEEQDPINIEAVEILGRLHDALEVGGYSGHQLERFLVRILFCLFGEDTGIFDRESFKLYLLDRTAEDGSDLGQHLAHLFAVLNTPPDRRQKNLDETLAAFAYVNGELFAENLDFADFNRDMRNALLACTGFDWSRISPAIFGSLFQAVMEPKERRQIGGHYTGQAHVTPARNISPYLIEGSDVVVLSRSAPVSPVPEIVFGNMPNDGGHLLLTDSERKELLKKEPDANKFIRPFLGSQEFINGTQRWCLWLKDAPPAEMRALPEVMKRVEAVKGHRLESPRKTTRELSKAPMLVGEIRQPSGKYLTIPKTSSARRAYIPMAFLDSRAIARTELFTMADATLFYFGVLSSAMQMAWVKQVCGSLKSDFRYSASLVYNNYPWPEQPTAKQRAAVEAAAQAVLDARKAFPNETLAALYDPLAMPKDLVKAHAELDRAVDLCYRPQRFENDRQRVEHRFALYGKLTVPLIAPAKKGRRKTHSN